MHGYAGKIGFINLSRNKVTVEGLSEDLIKDYLGGISFLTRLLYDTVPRGADPYGPENALIFAIGPLNGTLSPASSAMALPSPVKCGGIRRLKSTPARFRVSRFGLPVDKTTAFALKE